MKYTIVILIVAIMLSACATTTETQNDTIITEPEDVVIIEENTTNEDEEEIDLSITPQSPPTVAPAVEDSNVMPQFNQIRAFTNAGSGRTFINQFRITLNQTEDVAQVLSDLQLVLTQRNSNTTLRYDALLDCASATEIIAQRKTRYGYNFATNTICVAPPVDIQQTDSFGIHLVLDNTTIDSVALQSPYPLRSREYVVYG